MPKRLTRAERAKLRAAGMRPIEIWVPDTRAPGFAEECARQSKLVAAAENTPEGRAEIEFWEQAGAEAWGDEPD